MRNHPVLWTLAIVLSIAALFGLVWINFVPPGDGQQIGSAQAADGPPPGSVYADEAAMMDSAVTLQGTEGGKKVWKRQANNLYHGKIQAPECAASCHTGVKGVYEYIEVPVGAELIMKFDSPEDARNLAPSSDDEWQNSYFNQLRPAESGDPPDYSYRSTSGIRPIDITKVKGDEVHFKCPGATGFTLIKSGFHGGIHLPGRMVAECKYYNVRFVER